MHILSEIRHLARYFLSWFIALFVVSALCFTVGFTHTVVNGYSLIVPIFTSHSITALLFTAFVHNLVPPDITLIVTDPVSLFAIEMQIALFLGFLLTFPFFLYTVLQYVFPALYPHERRFLILSTVPSAVLFCAGAAFAYYLVIPPTFSFLYGYAAGLPVTAYFGAGEFIGTTLSLMLLCGVMFLLPVAMVLLTRLQIVHSSFWISHWHHATILFLMVTAIVTPDGSGVSMLLLTAPLLALYFIGIVAGGRSKYVISTNQ